MRRMLVMASVALVMAGATLPAVVRQFYPPMPAADAGAGGPDGEPPAAVVVLGGGLRGEGDQARLNLLSLRRVQLGLREAWQRDLPLLLSGGAWKAPPEDPAHSEAALMEREVLRVWPQARTTAEPRSTSTWENAEFSAALLRQRGVDTVVLVTHRVHMPRAVLSFRAQGVRVIPASLDPLPTPPWAPSAGALSQLPVIWREWAALLWYHFKYRL